MSHENVEIIRAANHAWHEGDMDAFRDCLDPEVIVQTVGNWPGPGPYVGRESVMGFYRSLRAAFDEDRLRETSEYLDLADHVVVRLVMDTVGYGPPANLEATIVFQRPQGQDPPCRVLLGPRRRPRSRRAFGVGIPRPA